MIVQEFKPGSSEWLSERKFNPWDPYGERENQLPCKLSSDLHTCTVLCVCVSANNK